MPLLLLTYKRKQIRKVFCASVEFKAFSYFCNTIIWLTRIWLECIQFFIEQKYVNLWEAKQSKFNFWNKCANRTLVKVLLFVGQHCDFLLNNLTEVPCKSLNSPCTSSHYVMCWILKMERKWHIVSKKCGVHLFSAHFILISLDKMWHNFRSHHGIKQSPSICDLISV